MTAAIAQLMRPSVRASSSGWPARVLTVLALVLCIPLCAALGLSLPLPATVARIAAKLVPFANSAVLDGRGEQLLGGPGSIVRFPGEPGPNRSALASEGSPAVPGPHNAGGGHAPGGTDAGSMTASPNGTANTTANTTPVAGEHSSSVPRQTDPTAGPASSGGSTSPPDTGTTPPQDGPVPPVPPSIVDTAAATAATVVGTVGTTATTATSTVPATAAPVVGVVTGVVGSVFPPKP
jgi:hypothetical protein